MSVSDTQCTNITIVNDTILEGTETFTVQLTTEDIALFTMPEDKSLFTPRYATVTILDDDNQDGE